MSIPASAPAWVLFLIVPAIVFFGLALWTGTSWLLVAPVVAWPLVIAGGGDEGWIANWIVPAAVSEVGVGVGLLAHRLRKEPAR